MNFGAAESVESAQEAATMHNLIFTTLAVPGKGERDTLLLVESLRAFGGDLASNPIWVIVPIELGGLSDPTIEKLTRLNARLIPFEFDPEIFKFPFAAKVLAAAALEAQVEGLTERIVYMDRDTIVLNEPDELVIRADRSLGYRPVHHKLIGSAWDQPLDSFWNLVYAVCDVPEEHLFPMVTHAGERIRPYFNAGSMVIRPQRGLSGQWRDTFLKWYRQPRFKAYYEKDRRYAVFMHQVIFTGVCLHHLKPAEMFELSPAINYPLHLHDQIPAHQRPDAIDELISVRHEDVFDQPDWERLPISETLKGWLKTQPRVQARSTDI
jgi:hypothetical protein